MSDDPPGAAWEPQFRTQGEEWFRLILEASTEERARSARTGPDLLFGELLRYGLLNDGSMIPDLQQLYRGMLKHGIPLEVRRQIAHHVNGFFETATGPSANVFLPLIVCEPDRGICSTAVLSFVTRAQASDTDPLSEARNVISMVQNRVPENVGAVFGGLMYLGDPRICRLLWPLRHQLTDEEVNEASLCFTGYLSSSTTDFQLEWLADLNGRGEDHRFGIVASGLALQRRAAQAERVFIGNRPIPLREGPAGGQANVVRSTSLDAYTEEIRPRLLALAREEREPKVLPDVLDLWGIRPD